MRGSVVDFAVQNNDNYVPVQNGSMYPQQMEWLMQQQRMQCNQQAINASRAYHLEPMNAAQQQQMGQMGQQSPQQQPQTLSQTGSMMMSNGMGMLQPYGQMDGMPSPPPPQQQQQMGQQMGMAGNGMQGYGGPGGMGGTVQSGNGMAYGNCNFGGMASPHSLSSGAGSGGNGNGLNGEGGAAEWSQINFQGVLHNAADPQLQQNLLKQDDGTPLPFPPSHLLAQYPPDYQQQMVFYYRLLRLQYPELYQQYVNYYETFYEPLYFPHPPTPEVKEHRVPPPKKKAPPPQHLQPRPAPPPQPVASPPQMQQPLSPPVQEPPAEPPHKKPEGLQHCNSTLNGGTGRQSSLRRQNSMRRAEVNQLKNEGGLRRLPSMRKS